MTKKILAILVALLLVGSVSFVLAGCGGDLPKNSLAKVGNTVITQQQLDARVADFEAQYASTGQIPDKTSQPDQYKAFQQDVLEYMVVYEMAAQKAKELNITITDEDVQKEIDSIKDNQFGGDQAQFDDALQQQGMTMDQLKQSYKESMLLQKVYDEATKSITTVPDSDVQAYYDSHKSDYFVDETRTVRHILIAPDPTRVDGTTSTTSSTTSTTESSSTTGSSTDDSSATTSDTSTATASSSTTTTAAPTQKDWDAALETANKVRADLVAGADWTAEAAKYSDDPGSKDKGGDLGIVYKGEMVKEFEDAVFSQSKDEISQPVKTTYGYHIIQVTDITPSKQYTLDEVKDEIKSTLLSQKKSDAWLKWIDDQKKAIGVTYAGGWEQTTTTTAPASTDTTSGGSTTTAAPSTQSETTEAPSSTTTTAGSTITTGADTTSSSTP